MGYLFVLIRLLCCLPMKETRQNVLGMIFFPLGVEWGGEKSVWIYFQPISSGVLELAWISSWQPFVHIASQFQAYVSDKFMYSDW